MFFIYIILIEMWLAGMTEVLRASWQGTFAWMLRERGMAGAGVALEPLINVGGWFVFYAMIMYFIFYIKSILVFGKDFIEDFFSFAVHAQPDIVVGIAFAVVPRH